MKTGFNWYVSRILKNSCSRPKIEHERSKNATQVGKPLTLLSQLQIKTWIKQNKAPKRIENKIQLVCIKDLKNTCYRPKNDNERPKNVAEDGKSLCFAPTIAN